MADAGPEREGVAFSEAVRVWARVAALSFGGPAGQIAVMHRILVEEKRWIGEKRFLHALNFCMLLPGPEAHQLTIYLGWLLHGARGGLVAGLLFVLPGFLAIMGLSLVYVAFGQTPLVAGLLYGIKAAVLAIVLQALIRIGSRALTGIAARVIAVSAFAALFLFGAPFPAIVLGAGLIGALGAWAGWGAFAGGVDEGEDGTREAARGRAGGAGHLTLCAAVAFAWLAPVAILLVALGPEDVFARLAVFFSQMAVLTFGGAYAVLAWVAQEAVQNQGWLSAGEMLDGLGMAETTPGPLIQVVQFVGFLAAFREAGGLNPYLAGVLGAVLVTWVTFTPSFLWIFLGAPWIERLRGNAVLAGALAAITAAVVGVIANLALWFALHVVFSELRPWTGLGMRIEVPIRSSLDPAALILTGLAIVAVFRLRLGMGAVLGLSALLGLGWTLAA